MHQTPGPATPARRVRPLLNLERLEGRDLPSYSSLDALRVDPTSYDSTHVIVAFRSDPGPVDLSAVSSAVARTKSTVDLGNGLFRLDLSPGESVGAAIAYFEKLPNVCYAQPDYQVSVALTPNDTSFTSQWGLLNAGQTGGTAGADVSATRAWNITTGTGRSIVAVIDTGVDITHPDLAANIWTNTREIAGNGRDDDGDGFVDDVHGWNFLANNNNVMDDNGHGTHVAGIIGALGNNGVGVAGIDWHVQIMPLKFLDSHGNGSLSNAVLALNYAVAHGATVSNNSYGGGGYFYGALNDAIAAAARAGHIFVAAAGNNSANNDASPNYPANYNLDNILSVAATDANDRLASFSNYGAQTVDLGAPGVGILSTYRRIYASLSGTSMATPFVTGAVALLRDLHPDWSYSRVINQILATTDPVPSLRGKTLTGGRLNVYRALAQGWVDTNGPSVTAAVFSGASSTSLNNLRVTFSKPIDAATFTTSDIVSFTRGGVGVGGVGFTITPVSGTSNQFDIGFTTQTQVGSYALTFGPEIRDTAGNAMNQNGNSVNGEAPGDRYTATGTITGSTTVYSADPIKAIPDLGRITSILNVTQDLTVGRLSVRVNVTHPNDGDLKITLQSPWGATVVLANRRGGSGDDFRTVFDDRAATLIRNGSAPFLGWHKPEEALSAFGGRNARGTWTLIVDDLARGNTGRLTGWSITVDPAAGSASMTSLETPREQAAIFWHPTSSAAMATPLQAPSGSPVFPMRVNVSAPELIRPRGVQVPVLPESAGVPGQEGIGTQLLSDLDSAVDAQFLGGVKIGMK